MDKMDTHGNREDFLQNLHARIINQQWELILLLELGVKAFDHACDNLMPTWLMMSCNDIRPLSGVGGGGGGGGGGGAVSYTHLTLPTIYSV